jgi:phosphoribosylanthranilate isomerase
LDNFRKAMEILNPDIMDFNSALETEPGKKSHVMLSELFDGLKS